MLRAKAVVLLAASVLAFAGCTSEGDGSPESVATPPLTAEDAEHSDLERVTTDDLSSVERASVPMVTESEELIRESDTEADPRQGELFAMMAGTYFLESRHGEIDRAAVERLVDGPDSLVNYIVQDQVAQVSVGTNRHVDVTVSPWLRSTAQGETVQTQLNAYMHMDWMGEATGMWILLRIDVRHDGHGWRVTGYKNEAGPWEKDLRPKDVELFFDGKQGWRRIPAA